MKKVSLVVTAVALTIGVSTAFAAKHVPSSSKFLTQFQYTNGSGGILLTATRTKAQELTGCTGSNLSCGKAWTKTLPHTREAAFDIFQAD